MTTLLRPRRFSQIESTCAVIIGGGFLALGAASWLPYPRLHQPTFLAGASLAWALIGWQLWRHRSEAATLGAATSLTLLRAWMVAVVAGHVLLPPAHGAAATLIALLYTGAAILDGVDGRVARKNAHTTALGAHLDVRADALGLLVAPLVAVLAGRLPPWYLLLSFAYPALRAGLRWRERQGLPVYRERLRPDPRARFFAGVQMGVVATALYPVLPAWLLWSAATVAMVPTLWLFANEWRLATSAAPPAG